MSAHDQRRPWQPLRAPADSPISRTGRPTHLGYRPCYCGRTRTTAAGVTCPLADATPVRPDGRAVGRLQSSSRVALGAALGLVAYLRRRELPGLR
jgi:hypothetical protein